LAEIF